MIQLYPVFFCVSAKSGCTARYSVDNTVLFTLTIKASKILGYQSVLCHILTKSTASCTLADIPNLTVSYSPQDVASANARPTTAHPAGVFIECEQRQFPLHSQASCRLHQPHLRDSRNGRLYGDSISTWPDQACFLHATPVHHLLATAKYPRGNKIKKRPLPKCWRN